MFRKITLVACLASLVSAGVVDSRTEQQGEDKKGENKPNIVKDYICLRDGELCHPGFAKNRGVYVSCSNGVAWEQQCPKCIYHPITCPTRTLWFDGEKCDWASPKLASQPCLDRFPGDKDIPSTGGLSEQEVIFQSLQAAATPVATVVASSDKPDRNKWSINQIPVPGSNYYKAPKQSELEEAVKKGAPSPEVAEPPKGLKGSEPVSDHVEEAEDDRVERKVGEGSESEFPSYLTPEDSDLTSKIVRISEPVYALVNSPDGSGKQVLMRVFQPFTLEETARGILPIMNLISPYAIIKE